MPIISVIVPVYNVEKYLSKCIDSIINQSLTDIEIILVNDGSTDGSGLICDKYALKDSRIKVLHKSNGGLSDARNKGIEVATGEYIGFIDSDDWISKNMFEKLYNISKINNADIVQSNYIESYNEDISIDKNINEEISIYSPMEMLEQLYTEKSIKTVVVWNKLYRRELFKDIRFPKGKIHEDEFTTYKLIHKSRTVADINLPLYYYRQREGSIMKSNFSIKNLSVIEAIIERKSYFEIYGLRDLQLKTEAKLCNRLKEAYINVIDSNIENKCKVLKKLKDEMKKNYIDFVTNKYIKLRWKITLTLCILNGSLFYKISKK